MSSTFFGLEMSKRALQTQQTALNITGHNISNSNTKGYTRQTPNIQAMTPDILNNMGNRMSIGAGVNVKTIERVRDAFVDRQYRWENSNQQYWAAREDSLGKIEGLVNEPSDYSLSDDLDQFWNAWSDLSKNPENLGSRSVVLERAATLADTFHHLDQQITEMQKGLDSEIRVEIKQVNDYSNQIKSLNEQIKRAEIAGDNPNDLKDKRDAIVDELSNLVNVRVVESKDPSYTDRDVSIYKVYIGSDSASDQILVDDTNAAYQLAEPTAAGSDGLPFADVKWATGSLAGKPVNLGENQGKLKANLNMRGPDNTPSQPKESAYLVNLRDKINELAKGIAEAVNDLHKLGKAKGITPPSDVPDFFVKDGTGEITAANIKVNSDLKNDPWKIATGKTNYGDGEIAKAIASLSSGWEDYENITLKADGTIKAASFGDYYGAAIAELGVDAQQATRMRKGQDVLLNNMYNQRETISGVNLDEEITNLIKYQKSYTAAARMVTMMDDMLDTIVRGMGITR
ncbi:flagellar hook-associated protein FlgK [Desulfitobacterium sp.]|uniref:flagellar hook-associated protein FlgK n=1 Tax=Desulfitobacterium sp. TaxID=49981 RepID=UPI002B1FFAF3|nr:flagellar hook-associated protein FlgK [Desulfitobacterium sp.]MEA4902175.1 flagellar hook-associated protein FlgK [Desulfitobacterium sp.]